MMYLSQSSETMDARAQCVRHDLEDDAEKLLRRVLAVLSRDYSIHMQLHKYLTGDVCIFAAEPVVISVVKLDNNQSSIFFNSSYAMLDALVHHRSIIYINTLSHRSKDIRIDFTSQFGTSIEELKVKLDLAE